jgi:hypothetical protein
VTVLQETDGDAFGPQSNYTQLSMGCSSAVLGDTVGPNGIEQLASSGCIAHGWHWQRQRPVADAVLLEHLIEEVQPHMIGTAQSETTGWACETRSNAQ